ncbi:hypothetical protein KHP60_00150 [Microvirga sp. 3-52]|jgi:hypothetical protein|uniref:hypothetical protein n=1 Tax=Microvirga sp. 3-52 TaxID=2792425 RepID=UPI001ACD90E1|nr:hypothetical protein [Microvirga sp. 3-52]MBO1903657.1 hypothetical protein [Microvirga sp. 3-52]MBS7450754.1 hypothetical protein [Microvirga sp. 3-52]
MENYQFSDNDIFQDVYNTALGGNATSAQVASIADPDALLDAGSSWFGGGSNVQESFNDIDQFAVNTAIGGNATSAQVASISDGDTLVDTGHDMFGLYF